MMTKFIHQIHRIASVCNSLCVVQPYKANSDYYNITYNSELTKSTFCSQRHCDARMCKPDNKSNYDIKNLANFRKLITTS